MTLITGAAGFIGYHLTRKLAEAFGADDIVAVDSFNDYYDPALKKARAGRLKKDLKVDVHTVDITDFSSVERLFRKPVRRVIHLAAQAGVRYSIQYPRKYIDANVVGFTNVLDAARSSDVEHIIYASSSSVYGNTSEVPFREDRPLKSFESLYAVTKAANEMTAQVFSGLYGLKLTGLRFFTVYGSWGRPDMAYYSFADSILKGKPIAVFNNGNLERDFTHVSDTVGGIMQIVKKGPSYQSSGPNAVYNIGRGQPVRLMEFISTIEDLLGKKAKKVMKPMQPGDVNTTWADVSSLEKDFGYKPKLNLRDGLKEFIDWYKEYNHV